jgi:hypothetical protein
MLFDWLVVGQIIEVNPARTSVRILVKNPTG